MKGIFLLALAWPLLGNAQDLSLYEKREYRDARGSTLPYRILLPPSYDRAKKYPLVLVLHGAGERGRDNEKQLTHGAQLFLRDTVRQQFPAIVVFPQCPEEGYWSSVKVDRSHQPFDLTFDYQAPGTEPLRLAMELVQYLQKKEAVDPKRIYITGLSMGGMGTFEAVYRFPKMFAAALPICGGGDVTRYDRRVRKVPFWVFHGEADAVVGVVESRMMVEKMKKLGICVKYTEYPGVNHNSWDNAFAEPEFLKWMFEKK